MIIGYGEKLKPYLVQTLTSLGCVVNEGKLIKTAEPDWETPQVFVEMIGDVYNGINWTTVGARITATIESAEAEKALERANNLLAYIARGILRNVEYGLPRIAGIRPPWLPGSTVEVSRPAKPETDPHNIKLAWDCKFLTPCGGI